MAKVNPTDACFAHRHLTVAEFGLWTLGRELSYKKSLLYFDGRNMAKRFRRGSKSQMYRLMHALIDAGWFEVLVPATRKSNGQWSTHNIRVLTHDEWVSKCGNAECKNSGTCPASGNGERVSPVPSTEHACPKYESLPVPPAGHKLNRNLQSDINLQPDDNLMKACPVLETSNFVSSEGTTCPKSPTETEAMEHQMCAAVPKDGTGPVPSTGTDTSGCAVASDPPVSPPVPKPVRRTRSQLEGLANVTRTTVDALLASGKFELAT